MPIAFYKIRDRRDQLKLTQLECAQRAGWFSPGAANPLARWNDFEKGRFADPRLSTIEAACRALECSIADILEDERPARAQSKRKRPSGAAGSKG